MNFSEHGYALEVFDESGGRNHLVIVPERGTTLCLVK